MNRVIFTLILLVGLVGAAFAVTRVITVTGTGISASGMSEYGIEWATKDAEKKLNKACNGDLSGVSVVHASCGEYECAVTLIATCTEE